jgi:glyoxylase-like metal-dependent hydrolase (beta-lactamase superfamily II)
LFDREHRLLFTGDTWYDASLWLFAHGTNLDDYDASLGRLLPYESNADYLLGAHNLARVGSGRLEKVQDVLREIREGAHQGEPDDYGRLSFDIEGVKILTSQPALDGTAVGGSPGGSGLESSF